MRPLREHLSRGCDQAGAAPQPRGASEGARRIERGGAVQLCALRQALWHATDDRQHARPARRPFDVYRRHAAPADVRGLPRDRHDGEQVGSADHAVTEMSASTTPAPEEQARANFYALLSRLFYAPPEAALLAALGQADRPQADHRM